MQKAEWIAVFILLLILSSCKSKIVGSWEFIEVYEGNEIKNIDTLRFKNNVSEKGNGMLTFNDNLTFTFLESKGNYLKKGKVLKMKYPELKDTTLLKISYLDKNYLLLTSESEKQNTWFYKKIKIKRIQ